MVKAYGKVIAKQFVLSGSKIRGLAEAYEMVRAKTVCIS